MSPGTWKTKTTKNAAPNSSDSSAPCPGANTRAGTNIIIKIMKQHQGKYLKNQGWIKIVALLVLAFIGVPALAATLSGDTLTGGIALATAGALTFTGKEAEELVGEVKSIKGSTDELVKNFDNLDKQTKKDFEELRQTTIKSNATFEDRLRAIMKVQASLRNESRMAFGDPLKKWTANPDLARGLVRMIVDGCAIDKKFVKRDLDEGNTPGSTFIKNNEVEKEIYDTLLSYGAFRTLDVRQISTKATEARIKTVRAAMTFIDEAAAITADSGKAGAKVTLTVKKLAGLISASSELLEDDDTGVEADIIADFMEALAYKLDWISFQADGTADATDGGFTGMFHAGTAAAAASGNVSIATLDYADFLRCLTTVDPSVLSRAATKWWIHPTILAKMLGLVDGNGRPMFLSAIDAPSYGGIGSILGYGVVPTGAAPSADTTSSKVACFGDGNAMAVRIRKDFRFDRSEQWAFDTDEITFRATARAAAKIKIATGIAVLTHAAS